MASINRDVRTGDTSQGLTKNWDGQEMLREQEANAKITAMFGQQASKAIADYSQDKVKELREQAKGAEGDEQKQRALLEEAKKWEEGGTNRVRLHIAAGGLSGGVPGALGAGIVSSQAPLLEKLQDNISESLEGLGTSPTLAKTAARAIGRIIIRKQD